MLKGVSLILLLGMATSAAAQSSSNISCKAVGSWGCAADGICVDSAVHRGETYRIDFKRMIVRGPRGNLSIQPAAEVNNRKEWQLGSGGRLSSMGRVEHPGDEKRDYDRYWLFNADGPLSPIELWCAS
jgi:hypothetical protein